MEPVDPIRAWEDEVRRVTDELEKEERRVELAQSVLDIHEAEAKKLRAQLRDLEKRLGEVRREEKRKEDGEIVSTETPTLDQQPLAAREQPLTRESPVKVS
jgi:chromosome segregation ATPase